MYLGTIKIYDDFLTIEDIKSVFHKLEFTHDFKTFIQKSLWSIFIIVKKINITDDFWENIKSRPFLPKLCGYGSAICQKNLSLSIDTFFYPVIFIISKLLKTIHNKLTWRGDNLNIIIPWDNQMQHTQVPLHISHICERAALDQWGVSIVRHWPIRREYFCWMRLWWIVMTRRMGRTDHQHHMIS